MRRDKKIDVSKLVREAQCQKNLSKQERLEKIIDFAYLKINGERKET
jgi:hypothetical protein